MYEYLKNLDFKPKNILDLGAWNGIWTREVKKFWPNAHYTCIEAGEKHKGRLLKCANEVFITVLGNENKEVDMHLRKIKIDKITYTKGSNIFGLSTFPSEAIEKRKMQTLESVVGVDATYDFIKQDIQGAELLVMQGSPDIFKRATYVLNEVNLYKDSEQPLVPDVKEMDLFMQSLGFDNSAVIDDHGKMDQIDKLYWKN
jgi:FkbM family methyltransferase